MAPRGDPPPPPSPRSGPPSSPGPYQGRRGPPSNYPTPQRRATPRTPHMITIPRPNIIVALPAARRGGGGRGGQGGGRGPWALWCRDRAHYPPSPRPSSRSVLMAHCLPTITITTGGGEGAGESGTTNRSPQHRSPHATAVCPITRDAAQAPNSSVVCSFQAGGVGAAADDETFVVNQWV